MFFGGKQMFCFMQHISCILFWDHSECFLGEEEFAFHAAHFLYTVLGPFRMFSG